MVRLRKRHAVLSVAGVIAALLLVALPVGANTKQAQPHAGSTLTLWYDSQDSPAQLSLYAAYQTATGNKLNLVPLSDSAYAAEVNTKWQTGQRPDILEFYPGLAQMSTLNPPADLLSLSKLAFVKREGNLAKSSGAFNGKVYAATLGPNSYYGIFYNKSVLKAAGVKPPTTFTDLFKACKTLKSSTLFEAGGSGWPPYNLAGTIPEAQANVGGAYDNALISGKQSLTAAHGAFVLGLDNYNKLNAEGCFNTTSTTATFAQSVQALLSGQTAMVVQLSSSMVPQLNADENGNQAAVDNIIGYSPIGPTAPVIATSPSLYGTYFVPNTGNTANEQAAEGFINWITGPGYANYVRQGGTISTMSNVRTPKTIQELYVEMATAAKKYGTSPSWLVNLPAAGAMATLLDQVLAKQITPQLAASQFLVSFNQAVALLKQEGVQ